MTKSIEDFKLTKVISKFNDGRNGALVGIKLQFTNGLSTPLFKPFLDNTEFEEVESNNPLDIRWVSIKSNNDLYTGFWFYDESSPEVLQYQLAIATSLYEIPAGHTVVGLKCNY